MKDDSRKKPTKPSDFILESAPDVPSIAHDLKILQSLRRVIRAVDIFSKRLMKEHKISSPQLMCLHKLVEFNGLTVSQLSKEIFLSPSTVVGILDRLERQGLVERVRSTIDRRKVTLNVTTKGRFIVEEAPSPLQKALQEGLTNLSEERRSEISGSMETLVEILEIQRLDASPVLVSGALMDVLDKDPQDPIPS